MHSLSRRRFLQRASAATVGVAALYRLPASIVHAATFDPDRSTNQLLAADWEYLKMPLSGPWGAWTEQALGPWQPVSVPHCFNSYDGCDPETPAFRGKGWYRRHLAIANPYPGGRTLLHFEGAGQSSEVYIGQALAGRHTGGYDEFVVDITSFLELPGASDKKGVRLAVLCDNSPDLERMPSDLSDFTLYGGLYRNVHLVYVPALSLERVHVHVKAEAGKPASVKVDARLYDTRASKGSIGVKVEVTDARGELLHRSEKQMDAWDGTMELDGFSIPSPKLWSPGDPHLYTCKVSIGSGEQQSTQTERFGVRFFEFADHGPFLLNGGRLLIRGTHRHEDHAGFAAAMPADLIRREMTLIKTMGANFIRLGHYQQQRLVLDMCDELGILVWEEVPWCRAGIGDAAFQQQGREKLTTMIDQHRNHPSVILWGLGNEDDWEGEYPRLDRKAIHDYMEELRDLAHRLDSSRLTSYRRGEFVRDVPDVYAPSIWAGWYGGRFVEYEASLTAQQKKSKRMLHVEWGADAHARRHAEDPYKKLAAVKTGGETAESGMAYLLEGGTPRVSRDGDWSESYACDLYDWHLKVQESLPWLTGAVHWTFKDFTTPLRADNPVPRVNQKGVVERDLTLKEGFYVFQSYWAAKPMAHIYGHTWPVRWGAAGEHRTVKVYSNCATAELFVNGASVGVRKREAADFPAAGLRWEVPFRAGKNDLRVVATAADGTAVSDQLSFSYQVEAWGAPARMTLQVVERQPGRVTVEARALDAHGVLCLDAANSVHFTVAGSATLIDNLGTSTGSRIVQMYNGRARVSLQYNEPARATVGVATDGIPSEVCNL